MAASLLAIKDLRVAAPGGAPVLDGVSLRLDRGEALGIVGESGCGKSTVAAAILGLLPPGLRHAGGEVRLDGRDLLALPEAARLSLRGRRVALIAQDPGSSLNPAITIGGCLVESLRRHRGLGPAPARAEAAALLARVGVAAPLSAYPHVLSGGMAQRVAIARALAGRPALLVADEPTTALDVTTQAEILDLLQALRREEGLALVLITHDLGVIAEAVDRIAVMYCGRVVETGPVAAVLNTPRHPYAAGLIAAVPSLRQRRAPAPIPGAVPPVAALPAGCAFHPRCAQALPPCRHEAPAPRATGRDAWAACHAVAA